MKNKNFPLLSVIIPVYNAEKHIEKCIQSIYTQSYQPIEIILIDDGSTDNSGAIAEGIAGRNNNILFFRQKNCGVSAARNTGLRMASGDYITFVDADDYLDKKTYSVIMDELLQNHCDAAIYPFSRHHRNGSSISLLPWPNQTILSRDEIHNLLIPSMIAVKNNRKRISGSVCRTVFRREAIDGLLFDESVHIQEDLIFCIRSYAKMQRIEIINDVFYHYIKYGTTATEQYRKDFLSETMAFENAIIQALKEHHLYQNMIPHYWAKRITAYSLCLSNLFRPDAPENIDGELNSIINRFARDPFIQKHFHIVYLQKRFWIPYILLCLKARFLTRLIYESKEKYRQKTFHD